MIWLSPHTRLLHVLCSAVLLTGVASAHAIDHDLVAAIRGSEFAVTRNLQAPPAPVVDLKFQEFFRLPVGPRGLEATERLRALDDKQVRLVGFMVQQEQPIAGRFILAPMPLQMSEDEDGLADDLPPSVVYVHFSASSAQPMPFMPGLLQFTGMLQVGSKQEEDGRVSAVRLVLDSAAGASLQKLVAR